MKTVQKIMFAAAIFILAHCGSSETPVDPTLSSIQTHIFNKSCALSSCHSSLSKEGNLDLSEGNSFSDLVGVLADNDAANAEGKFRVVAGDPDNSFLVQKLEGPGADEGEQMPQRNSELSNQKISAIREWITNGALDN